MPAVEDNLSHPSQAMRCATLRLLCCFEQPAMHHSSSSTPKPSTASSEASQILPMFLSIQSQTCTVDSGRQAAVTIGKVRTYLEYGQVPPDQVPAVIRCLLGVLHIRYANLATAATNMVYSRPGCFAVWLASPRQRLRAHRFFRLSSDRCIRVSR